MKIYEKLRENGAISNVKTRTLLAADMKMAPSHAAQFMKVDAKGSMNLLMLFWIIRYLFLQLLRLQGCHKKNRKKLLKRHYKKSRMIRK